MKKRKSNSRKPAENKPIERDRLAEVRAKNAAKKAGPDLWNKPEIEPDNISPETAKRLCKMGHINWFVIWRGSPQAAWYVSFPQAGDRVDWLLTKRGEAREFKTLDTAHKACRRIGDAQIRIVDNTPAEV